MNRFGIVICIVAFVAQVDSGRTDEIGDRAKAVLKTNKDAIVTIQMVIKQRMSFPGARSEGQETKGEAIGTVIGPEGLTVVSLAATDPGSLMESMMGAFSAPGGSADDKIDFKMQSELTDVKILLAGGKELPAQVVLRDKDLDLAFIRPTEKPVEPLAYISLAEGARPEMFEQVVSIARLGKVGGRAESASIERIRAIILKPRTFYVPGAGESAGGFGSPVFALSGKPIGVTVMRVSKSNAGGFGNLLSEASDMFMPVIVPTEDILAAAKQVPPFGELKPENKDEKRKEGDEKDE